MAICLFTKKHIDGSGDIVQTVKIADFIQQFVTSSKLEEFKKEAVFIVVEDEVNKEIVNPFVKDINTNIQVKLISEFKNEQHKINCCIEAGYSHFDWEKDIRFEGAKPPLISMPEYDNNVTCRSDLKVYGGYLLGNGVIPSFPLLNATAGAKVNNEALQHTFEGLDPKIQSYLGKDAQDYLVQREERDFTYQYSHDRTTYPTFHTRKSDNAEEIEIRGKEYNPVKFFLHEHFILTGDSAKSQDVLCIGENSEKKLQALSSLKKDLIEKGYTKISFIDTDTKEEKLIHESTDQGIKCKEYRLLYSKSIPYTSMIILPLIATDIVGVTGDQTLIEAMSAKKLVTYECHSHKIDFAKGLLYAIKNEASKMDLKGTSIEEIALLAKYLIKETHRSNSVEYNLADMSRLLGNKNTVEALKTINRKLVENSQYFKCLEDILLKDVVGYIRNHNPVKKSIPDTQVVPPTQKTLKTSKVTRDSENPQKSLETTSESQIPEKHSVTEEEDVKKIMPSESLDISPNQVPSNLPSPPTDSNNPTASLEPKTPSQLMRIEEFKNSQKIALLLKQLHTEVLHNKRNSIQWNKRFEAATKLNQLANKKVIYQEDIASIKAELQIIKENEPSWFELSLITKILDVLSLGLIPLIRCLFFKSDQTVARLKDIEAELPVDNKPIQSFIKL